MFDGTRNARLRELNMTWEQYLVSSHWIEFKEKYRGSHFPQKCLGCGWRDFDLRHRTYQRLGCEELTDVAPLCSGCLELVVRHEQKTGAIPAVLHATLRSIFGWTKGYARGVFAPFRISGGGRRGYALHTQEQRNNFRNRKGKHGGTPKKVRDVDYNEYLRSPEWKAKRELVIKRCNGVCEECLEAKVDHVHHLTYVRLGHEKLKDLQGLCKACHQEKHPDRKLG